MINALKRMPAAVVAATLLVIPAMVHAQEGKSAPLAKELAQALDKQAGDMKVIAAKMPRTQDQYAAAMYFPGSQMLVVTARYAVPVLLDERLGKKDYREIYIDLNSASIPESKVMISDLGADGLKAKPNDNTPFDSIERAGKTTAFDGDWKKAKLSETDYMKAFSDADELYGQILQALLSQAKKTS